MLLAQAHQRATEAGRMSESPHKMQREFLETAILFLRCGEDKTAVNCLFNAREYGLLAKLLEKQGKVGVCGVISVFSTPELIL